MKKTLMIVALVFAALAALGVGAAYAQGSTPPAFNGRGHMGDGPLHDYMINALAEKLDLNVDELNTRLANGERLRDIALTEGVAEADLQTFMSEVRAAALDAAVKDGVITQEQADLMKTHGFGRGGKGMGNCDGTGPQGNGNGFQNQQNAQ